MHSRYLTAHQAAERLGVTIPTIYAYVSRGLIRSESVEGDTRQRRYRASDVERLRARKEARHYPEKMAAQALDWGAPLLDSAITLIDAGNFYYRGHDVLHLAVSRTIEEVAGLVWLGAFDSAQHLFDTQPYHLPERVALARESLWPLPDVAAFHGALALAAADDLAAFDLSTQAVVETGARILRLLTLVAAGCTLTSGSIVDTLAAGWDFAHMDDRKLVNAALILCADHELNISSFTARCVASAGATPYAAVAAGLSALSGVKHGGHTARVEALFDEVADPDAAADVIAARLRRGESVPGFGHRLYPDGDPRAPLLLESTAAAYPDSPALELAQAVIAAVRDLVGRLPTVDLGLVTVCRALGLPAGTPLTLFALGRTVGWIGHAVEQYETGQLIRPRARYVGPGPAVDFPAYE